MNILKKIYLENNLPHKENEPAIEYEDGTKKWFLKTTLILKVEQEEQNIGGLH